MRPTHLVSGYSRANQLYRNGGDGIGFVDVAQSAGVADGSNSYGRGLGRLRRGRGSGSVCGQRQRHGQRAVSQRGVDVRAALGGRSRPRRRARRLATARAGDRGGGQSCVRRARLDGGTGHGGQSVGPVLFGFGPTATSVDSLIEWSGRLGW